MGEEFIDHFRVCMPTLTNTSPKRLNMSEKNGWDDPFFNGSKASVNH